MFPRSMIAFDHFQTGLRCFFIWDSPKTTKIKATGHTIIPKVVPDKKVPRSGLEKMKHNKIMVITGLRVIKDFFPVKKTVRK